MEKRDYNIHVYILDGVMQRDRTSFAMHPLKINSNNSMSFHVYLFRLLPSSSGRTTETKEEKSFEMRQ